MGEQKRSGGAARNPMQGRTNQRAKRESRPMPTGGRQSSESPPPSRSGR